MNSKALRNRAVQALIAVGTSLIFVLPATGAMSSAHNASTPKAAVRAQHVVRLDNTKVDVNGCADIFYTKALGYFWHLDCKGAAIGTKQIVNSAVTGDKIADNAVNTDQIANKSVTNAKLADNFMIQGDQIANGSIGLDNLSAAVIAAINKKSSISWSDITGKPSSFPSSTLATPATTSLPFTAITGQIGAGQIANGSITDAMIGTGIQYSHIINGPTQVTLPGTWTAPVATSSLSNSGTTLLTGLLTAGSASFSGAVTFSSGVSFTSLTLQSLTVTGATIGNTASFSGATTANGLATFTGG
ncbi:MAG: hypothetical protein WCH31_08885, partial [Actinomycetes bacterium]